VEQFDSVRGCHKGEQMTKKELKKENKKLKKKLEKLERFRREVQGTKR